MTEYTSIYKVIKTRKHYEDNVSGRLRNERGRKKMTLKEYPKYFICSNCQIIT